MSCLLFVVVISMALRHLDLAHLSFVAFVDEVTVVVPRGQTQRTAETVQSAVGQVWCQLNVTKSDCLPVQEFGSPASLAMDEATPLVPSMHAYSDIEPCYAALQEQMLDSMDKRKAEKVELSPKAHDTHQEWTELIRTLSTQCLVSG